MNCLNCSKEFGEVAGYHVSHLDKVWDFCGRICLVEFLVPEVSRAIVPRQWIPTDEEKDRMRE